MRLFWKRAISVGILLILGYVCRAGEPPPHFANISTAALSQDGRVLAVMRGDDMALIATATGRTRHVLKGCGCTVSQAVFSPDGRLLTTYADVCSGGTSYWEAKVWDVWTGRLRYTLPARRISGGDRVGRGQPGPAALGFTPSGLLAAATDEDSFVRLWDLHAGKLVRLGQRAEFLFSSDGAATPMTPGLARILKTFSSTVPLEFTSISSDKRHLLTISGINILNGLVTAAAGPGKDVVLWDTAKGRRIRSFPLDGHTAYSASIGSGRVFVGGEDFARVWDLGSGAVRDVPTAPASADRFDWFGHSHVVWARLTQGGDWADAITVRLKPVANKYPHQYNPMWYTEAASFVQADTATCRETAVFTLPEW